MKKVQLFLWYFVVMVDQFSGLDTCAIRMHKIVHTCDLQQACRFAHKKDWYIGSRSWTFYISMCISTLLTQYTIFIVVITYMFCFCFVSHTKVIHVSYLFCFDMWLNLQGIILTFFKLVMCFTFLVLMVGWLQNSPSYLCLGSKACHIEIFLGPTTQIVLLYFSTYYVQCP